MISRIAICTAVAMTATAFADESDLPPNNPDVLPDGSSIYWAGNDMDWSIQDAIDDASEGDTIVIREGVYDDQILVNKANLTIRPFVDASGDWENVTFIVPMNPTEGGWAMEIGSDTENTYIGRPRQFRETTSGYVAEATIVPGEYAAARNAMPLEVDEISGRAFCFESHALNNTGIVSENGKATVELCDFTSSTGFGGGAVMWGNQNRVAFVDCEFTQLHTNGTMLNMGSSSHTARENHVISLGGGNPQNMFASCNINYCMGETIVEITDGGGAFTDTKFDNNTAVDFGSGIVRITSANPSFSGCYFRNNLSGEGTIYIDGQGINAQEPIRFYGNTFENNCTMDGTFGGVMAAVDSGNGNGGAPKVVFDDNNIQGNNIACGGGNAEDETGVKPDDFVSPWFFSYRQGDQNEPAVAPNDSGTCTPTADLNGDGVVNGSDLGMLFGAWGTDGSL